MKRTEQQREVHHSTDPPVNQEQEVEGFNCSACGLYVIRNDEASGTKCAECHQWFDFCERCMPDTASHFPDVEWLCRGCRQ